jgi:hypothetical protein
MRIGALILFLANLAVAAYIALGPTSQRSLLDVRPLEVNADQVKQLRDGSVARKPVAAACLEWGPLAAAELTRAREALTALKICRRRNRARRPRGACASSKSLVCAMRAS